MQKKSSAKVIYILHILLYDLIYILIKYVLDSRNKARAINAGSLDEIPEKYFIVTGSDMVRVKYLMVYREKSIFSVKSFVVKNLFFIVLLMYFLFIVSIGIFNNTTFLKFIKKFIKDY